MREEVKMFSKLTQNHKIQRENYEMLSHNLFFCFITLT